MAYWILNQIVRWHLKVDEILPYSHETHGRRDSAKNNISSRWFESRVWIEFWPANGPLNFVKKRQDSLVTFWTVHTKYANIIPLQLLTTTAFQEGSIVTTMVSKICLPTAKIRLFIELEQTHRAEDADPPMVHWTLWKKRQDALVTFWTVHSKYAHIIPLQSMSSWNQT